MNAQTLPSIGRIQELLEEWRTRGRHVLSTGTELLVSIEEGAWMHALFAAPGEDWLTDFGVWLDLELPKDLKLLYKKFGGASFFDGRVRIAGPHKPYLRLGDDALQPPDLYELNTPSTLYGETPEDAIVFGLRESDHARFLMPYPSISREVVAQLPGGDFHATWPSVWHWLQAVLEERDHEAALLQQKPYRALDLAKQLDEEVFLLPTPEADAAAAAQRDDLPSPDELLARLRAGEDGNKIFEELLPSPE